FVCFFLDTLVLIRDGQSRSGLAEALGNRPGDAALVAQPKHHRVFSLHAEHKRGPTFLVKLVRIPEGKPQRRMRAALICFGTRAGRDRETSTPCSVAIP